MWTHIDRDETYNDVQEVVDNLSCYDSRTICLAYLEDTYTFREIAEMMIYDDGLTEEEICEIIVEMSKDEDRKDEVEDLMSEINFYYEE